MWIIKNAGIFKINPKKIFLIGDSAGGNLVWSLTYLLIRKQLKLPSALIISYPALLLSNKIFIPSFIKSFDQILLNPEILLYTMNNYVNNYSQKIN